MEKNPTSGVSLQLWIEPNDAEKLLLKLFSFKFGRKERSSQKWVKLRQRI